VGIQTFLSSWVVAICRGSSRPSRFFASLLLLICARTILFSPCDGFMFLTNDVDDNNIAMNGPQFEVWLHRKNPTGSDPKNRCCRRQAWFATIGFSLFFSRKDVISQNENRTEDRARNLFPPSSSCVLPFCCEQSIVVVPSQFRLLLAWSIDAWSTGSLISVLARSVGRSVVVVVGEGQQFEIFKV
jgi:hypothetical protein